ncbi:hypothetical protein P3L10_026804 [Capsicum annuum]
MANPPKNYLKLNTDGCLKGNLGEAGGGGILRDHQGNISMAFQSYFGNCSNNMDEGLAILKGLQWCATNHVQNVIIEADSMIVIDMIKSKNIMVWQMQDIVKQIRKIMKDGNFQINYYFREANGVVDTLANNGVKEKHEAFFTEAFSLPRHVRVALKNDQDGLPNIGYFNFST